LVGVAGSGKSILLFAARQAWKDQDQTQSAQSAPVAQNIQGKNLSQGKDDDQSL
jgi:ABC-type dipeptide/oligopeptide/nickel transport system ATPase component